VKQPPQELRDKLEKPPMCHLLSTYVILPVASDAQPFFIHHKNRQPIIAKKKFHDKADEMSDDSDDEFEKVKTDKKRVKKPTVSNTGYNPMFPASDPTKVKLLGEKKEPVKAAPA
jgi:hypothetical protein